MEEAPTQRTFPDLTASCSASKVVAVVSWLGSPAPCRPEETDELAAVVLDRAVDPGLRRTMASRCTDVREWQTGHSPFVGQPDLTVELLRELLPTRIGSSGTR